MTIVETPSKRVLPARKEQIVCVVLHTTGETDLKKIIDWYTRADGEGPHYFIETRGVIHRHVSEDLVAWHCKIDPTEVSYYLKGYSTWSRYLWNEGKPRDTGSECTNYYAWRDTWRIRGKQSPIDLISGRRPNMCSIGIELQASEHPGPQAFTDAQYESLTDLLADIWRRRSVPLARDRILTHYDCSPLRRSNVRGPCDPPREFSFNRIWELLKIGSFNA